MTGFDSYRTARYALFSVRVTGDLERFNPWTLAPYRCPPHSIYAHKPSPTRPACESAVMSDVQDHLSDFAL